VVNGIKQKGKSPYAQTFFDTVTNKYSMEISGLPMVNANGERCIPEWELIETTPTIHYRNKANQFNINVNDDKVKVTAINDQPDGIKIKDKLFSYAPVLQLAGVVKNYTSLTLLATDPINPNYSNNTLEWDYGICKRRLRLIEGHLCGSWVFASNPAQPARLGQS
jgi:hypothetical protein